MCLIAFAIGTHPDLPLLLAGNRDEFFDRPTDALHRWPDRPGVWAGRDRRDGGTWLGLAENGRVAMLTNVRSPHPGPGARSRGELATRWLHGETAPDRFAADLNPEAYGGFNLVVGDLRTQTWTWLCNRDPAAPHHDTAAQLHRQDLAPGVYGLSNAVLDTPWPKAKRLTAALRSALPAATRSVDWSQPLQAALADDQPALLDELPVTGVDVEAEQIPFPSGKKHDRLAESGEIPLDRQGHGDAVHRHDVITVKGVDVAAIVVEAEWHRRDEQDR